MNYHSQYNEAEILLQYFNGRNDGHIVDIGAADGISNSNSYDLIKQLNFTAILVEPVKESFDKIYNVYKDNKNVFAINCAAGSKTSREILHIDNNDEYHQLSTIITQQKDACIKQFNCSFREQEIWCYKTQDLIEKFLPNKPISLLSIDTEGYDFEVLKGIDFNKTKIEVIIIELAKSEILEFLLYKGFKFLTTTPGNFIYVRKNT